MFNFLIKTLFIGLFFILSVTLYSQTKIDTFFYNNNLQAVSPEEASIIHIQKDSFLTEYQYTPNMKLISIKSYHLRKKANNDGYRVAYGAFEDYHENGQLRAKGNMFENQFQDTLLSYYEDGKALRIDQYEVGRLIKGQCFDKEGNEIAYFPYEVNPTFPGGQEALFKYLGENIRYPEVARQNNIEGVVYVGFVVNKDGSITDVTLRKDTYKLLAEEAIRVVKTLPNWSPGLRDGEKVRISYTLPIKFKLEDGFRLRDLFKRK